MRDLVDCHWSLPDPSLAGELFETASLGNGGHRYTITKEGRLFRRMDEEVPDYRSPCFTRHVELPVHGEVRLRSRRTSSAGRHHSVVARFSHGLVQWIKPLEEVGTLHDALSRACRNLPGDYTPWGDVQREDSAAPQRWWPDCSSRCRHFVVLQDAGEEAVSHDWGVCINPKSHRYGLLTFEHQGCPAFEAEFDD